MEGQGQRQGSVQAHVAAVAAVVGEPRHGPTYLLGGCASVW